MPAHGVCCNAGQRFLDHLRYENLTHISDKAELRSIYYTDVKNSDLRCSFSSLMYCLRRRRKIKIRSDVVSFKAYGFQPLAVDQYTALIAQRKAQQRQQDALQEQQQQQQVNGHQGAGQSLAQTKNRWYCWICKSAFNSEQSLRQHSDSRKHRQQHMMSLLKKNSNALIDDKNDVQVFCEGHDGDKGAINIKIRRNETKSVNIMITNKSKSNTVNLVRCELLKRSRVFKLSDLRNITQNKEQVPLSPGRSYTVNVTCRAKFFSRYRSPIAFEFKNPQSRESFHIIRFLSIIMSSDISDMLQPESPYIKPPRVSQYKTSGNVVDGWPPPFDSDKLKNMLPLGLYSVQTSLRSVINRGKEDELKPVLEPELNFPLYAKKMSKLLHIEEIQMEVDIRRYDMTGVTMEKKGRLLKLRVPGLAENRPSVLRGDAVYVQVRHGQEPEDVKSKRYKGYVHEVELEDICIGFSQELLGLFIKGMVFDVQFTFNRLPLRLQHRAVKDAGDDDSGLEPVLFPEISNACEKEHLKSLSSMTRMTIFNRQLERNAEQVTAVKHILAGTSRPAPYLLFGPPGTGKTVTVVEAIKQVYKSFPRSVILACAPSNSAADLIASRVLRDGPVAKSTILRLNALSRTYNQVDPELRDANICNYNRGGEVVFPKIEDLLKYRVIVATLVTAGRLVSAGIPKDHFTHIFMDEAGHAVEPETIIAVAGLLDPDNAKGGQLVLAGDPKQLGPILRSPLAIKYGLGKSLLERFMCDCQVYQREENQPYNSEVLTKLIRNYRSHPEILKLPNELFYEGELQVFADEIFRNSLCDWEGLPKQKFPIVFHGVEGIDMREGQSPSFFNILEVEIVWDYVKQLLQERRGGMKIKQEHIGIISPYRRQVQKIKKVLNQKNYNNIKVGSVEEFQGQERLIIIISTVRSTNEENLRMDIDYKLGFLKNPKRFNVAVTRAKALLIVVGNPFMLQKDPHWNRLLDYCRGKGAYTGCDFETDDDEAAMQDLIERFEAINLTPQTNEPVEKDAGGFGESLVSQYNDPEWRSES
ncbi:putative helicase MOV-10 [Ptychodera flava]|uniref:putative helicase MOV-10 n=1 Tax=Ptychodera flava TaxID=63121 RepID=UPI00396A13C4